MPGIQQKIELLDMNFTRKKMEEVTTNRKALAGHDSPGCKCYPREAIVATTPSCLGGIVIPCDVVQPGLTNPSASRNYMRVTISSQSANWLAQLPGTLAQDCTPGNYTPHQFLGCCLLKIHIKLLLSAETILSLQTSYTRTACPAGWI